MFEPRGFQGKRVDPHIDSLPKVIPLKLFLDMVPSFLEDVTREMRGQQKREKQNIIKVRE